jgi:hypothetical protein
VQHCRIRVAREPGVGRRYGLRIDVDPPDSARAARDERGQRRPVPTSHVQHAHYTVRYQMLPHVPSD